MSSRVVQRSRSRAVGRPPGATGDEMRRVILDAALEAFAEVGFEAMSVRQLTRRLAVSHNLVHHHFGSKEDLWRAALEHGLGPTVRELIALLSTSSGRASPRQILRQGVEQAVALLMRRPAVARILVHESTRDSPLLDELHDRYLGPTVDALSRFLARARRRGGRDVDPRVAALFVVSAASAQFSLAALAAKLGLGGKADGQYAKALAELVLGGLMEPEPKTDS